MWSTRSDEWIGSQEAPAGWGGVEEGNAGRREKDWNGGWLVDFVGEEVEGARRRGRGPHFGGPVDLTTLSVLRGKRVRCGCTHPASSLSKLDDPLRYLASANESVLICQWMLTYRMVI
jgi:hypothetical protein